MPNGTLSLARGGPIKCEAVRQGPSQPFYRSLSSENTAYFELPFAGNSKAQSDPRPLSSKASTTFAGSRIAKLFPYFDTRIAALGVDRIRRPECSNSEC